MYSNSWKDMCIFGYVVITNLVARVGKDAALKGVVTSYLWQGGVENPKIARSQNVSPSTVAYYVFTPPPLGTCALKSCPLRDHT